MTRPADWLRDSDPERLSDRIDRVMRVLDTHADACCGACDRALCGHLVLFALAAGYQDDPLCAECIAEELDRDATECERGLLRMVQAKECLRRGWRVADLTAERAGRPCCERATLNPTAEPEATSAPSPPPAAVPDAHDTWDAGDLGCGELVLKLRLRLREFPAAAVLHLRATDPGAPEDIPAWCRLTGHTLVRHLHPDYWIRRRD